MRFTNEIPERTANRRLTHLSGVKAKVSETTAATAARATANLASHYQEGEPSISWEMGAVDGYVTMDGDAALSVELGHHHWRNGSWVEGTRILRDALGGA